MENKKDLSGKTLIIEDPETSREWLKYAFDGVQMAVVGVSVLAWRGASWAVKTVCNSVGKGKGNGKGKGEEGGEAGESAAAGSAPAEAAGE